MLRSLGHARRVMTSSSFTGAQNGSARGTHFTVTALSRWSCLAKPLPGTCLALGSFASPPLTLLAVDKIKSIHIYDFDNTRECRPRARNATVHLRLTKPVTTVFKTPLPNPALWNGPSIGLLSQPDSLTNGGWWHDSRILAATGDGVEKEEARAWEGWWNEKVVDLVRLSMKQKDALCVLLTGRSERGFAELIKRICASKGLEFDMMGLKPDAGPQGERFNNTMHFKQVFLEAIMGTYMWAEEIRVYEDRHKHVKAFREFLDEYNLRVVGGARRAPLNAEVVHVMETSRRLDPVVEVAKVQQMANEHNQAIAKMPEPKRAQYQRLAIKKTVCFTSYTINHADSERLAKLAQVPPDVPEQDLKYHANNILICPRPCPASILEKVGGMGSKMRWKVTGTACLDNSIWAACLRPVPDTAKFHTDNPCPLVVLALRKGARPVDAGRIQNWQPVPADKAYVFETTVREKVLLRIEEENLKEDEYESLFANKNSKRKHNAGIDLGRAPKEPHYARHERGHHHGYQGRGGHQHGRGGFRGGPGGARGYRGGSRGKGRGRGGYYKSLDDVDRNQGFTVDYDDSQSARPSGPGGQGRGGNSDLQSYY